MQNDKKSVAEYVPQFKKAFLAPKYWGTWLGLGVMIATTYIPARVRDPMLGAVGRLAGKFAKSARRRARINLIYCFPEMDPAKREQVIDEMFAAAPQSFMLMAELICRSPQQVAKRVRWHGQEVIDKLRDEGRNIIFLVPHGWAVDVPAMLMTAEGQKMAAMFHNQRNELVDYIWNNARRKFGGRIHARKDGIKPFISSVRNGYWGFYLPDQDHGAEHSEFVDFFATYKATLPAVGRLMKVCRAAIVPLFPAYDGKDSILHIHIREPMDDLADADDVQIARRMNEEVEHLVQPNLDQYTWILKLLKTRKEGEIEPYSRKDL